MYHKNFSTICMDSQLHSLSVGHTYIALVALLSWLHHWDSGHWTIICLYVNIPVPPYRTRKS